MKRFKILLTTCLVICIAAVACVLGACTGDEKDNKEPVTNVTVTVLLPDNTPAADVSVGLCAVGEGGVGLCLPPVKTNAEGKANVNVTNITTDTIEIHLTSSSLPAGYVYADANGTAYEEGSGMRIPNTQDSVTITLKAA